MSRLARNFWTSLALALSDFIGFTIAMYIAMVAVKVFITNGEQLVIDAHVNDWMVFHICLGLCCVAWYSIRLRHYFYRKTFWFELKEILRTLVIFAVIEIAVMAFANWYFSRYIWSFTWFFVLCLVPSLRMLTKKTLDLMGLWRRETVIIGSGNNAIEAWKAIDSEKNLGFRVISFISHANGDSAINNVNDIPVIEISPNNFINQYDKRTQFIVALESNESSLRNDWLRIFMINGYRYVSVIPTLRGMPLDSTDMSFIFSHEVMIFRVHQNLAKISSRIIKRVFDIVGSLGKVRISGEILLG